MKRLVAASGRAVATAAALAAGLVAWRSGGGAERNTPPPKAEGAGPSASSASSASSAKAPGAGPSAASPPAFEVSTRLVEAMKDARIEGNLAAAGRALSLHWRKMKPAFVPLSGEAARWVTSIALRTSATETQWAMPSSKPGKQWAPDARVWNMNEGSFDQREALVSPPETTLSFRVAIPQGGRGGVAKGTLNTPPRPPP